jgi:uncharacterized membrane protein
MSDLIVISYPQESRAEEVQSELQSLQLQHLIDLEDSVYVTKGMDGKAKVHQSLSTTATGAAGGALWGTVFGLLFLMPLAGLVVGAGAGALAGKMTDVGVDDRFVKQLSNRLTPGSSALFVLVRSVTADKVVPEISRFGGTVEKTSLPNDAEDRLKEALLVGAPS